MTRSTSPALAARLIAFLITALTSAPATAQEILGVDFAGNAFAVGATARPLGPTGVTGCNATAVQNGVYYVSARNGNRHQLAVLDPFTAQATVLFPNLGVDLRGLADSPNPNELFGIVNGAPDRLVRINLTTGLVTNVGATGRTGIQALARIGNLLWAWDVGAGLLAMSLQSGATFDPFPFVGAQNADIQFLTVAFGQLRGGNHRMQTIDPGSGLVFAIGGELALDLRGGEFRTGTIETIGAGCSTGAFEATLHCSGAALAGTNLFLSSNGHSPGALGQLFTDDHLLAAPIPLPPLSCPLLVDFHVFVPVTLSNEGKLNLNLTLPSVFGVEHCFQLSVLEAPTSHDTLTNAIRVRVPF